MRSSSTSQGSHDSMPAKTSPAAMRSNASRPPGASHAISAARARIASSGRSSRQGSTSTDPSVSTLRWSETEKRRTVSTSSPQSSTRTGCGAVAGNTSRMPPRTANSPRASTRYVRS